MQSKDEAQLTFILVILGSMMFLAVFLLVVLLPTLFLLSALLACLFCFYKAYDSSRPIPEMRTDVDIETFYKYDSNDELIETPAPKVQNAPAVQEKLAEPLFVLKSPKYEEDLLTCPLHLASKLTTNQITTLEHHDCLLKEFVPLGKTRREKYYIQEQKPESFEHTFVVHSIVEKLKPFVQSVEVHRTQQPDIVFYYKGDKHALEVETPHHLPYKHSRLRSKAQRLTREYGVRWWFVTTRSAYAKTFAPYGSVLTRNQIDQWVQENFIPPKTPPPLNTI